MIEEGRKVKVHNGKCCQRENDETGEVQRKLLMNCKEG